MKKLKILTLMIGLFISNLGFGCFCCSKELYQEADEIEIYIQFVSVTQIIIDSEGDSTNPHKEELLESVPQYMKTLSSRQLVFPQLVHAVRMQMPTRGFKKKFARLCKEGSAIYERIEERPEAYAPFIQPLLEDFFPMCKPYLTFNRFAMRALKGEKIIDIGGTSATKERGTYTLNVMENESPDCLADITNDEHTVLLMKNLGEHRFSTAVLNWVPLCNKFLDAMRNTFQILEDSGEVHIQSGIYQMPDELEDALRTKDIAILNTYLESVKFEVIEIDIIRNDNVKIHLRKILES